MKVPPISQVWIGDVEVVSSSAKAVLGKGLRGGFSIMMAWANGRTDYRRQVIEHCEVLGVRFVRASGVKPFAGERKNVGLDPNLISAAGQVAKTMTVWYGTFHSFPKKKRAGKKNES